uniref:C-type lectin domain-containing protein n=1 Tax=Poecilia mexicana TaxID=48701 RepID=A0A3B3Z4F7_9TELE
MTWANAEKNCLSMGANLASVRNAYEYRRIQALIRAASRNSREAWLGGSDAQQERTWLWSDGSPMRYTNWCPGEPNNGGGSQHCLQMNYSGKENITSVFSVNKWLVGEKLIYSAFCTNTSEVKSDKTSVLCRSGRNTKIISIWEIVRKNLRIFVRNSFCDFLLIQMFSYILASIRDNCL